MSRFVRRIFLGYVGIKSKPERAVWIFRGCVETARSLHFAFGYGRDDTSFSASTDSDLVVERTSVQFRCNRNILNIAMPAFGGGFLFLLMSVAPQRSYAQRTASFGPVQPPPSSYSSSSSQYNSNTWKLWPSESEASLVRQPLLGTFRPFQQAGSAIPAEQKPDQDNKEKKQYSPTATTGSPGHIFFVEPAYKVNYSGKFEPLTPKEKFQEFAQGSYDPLGFAVTAFEAGTLEYSSNDGFCGYGHGWGGYGQCFGSLTLDSTVSSFIGDYALSVLWHQDPRYFRLGKGSVGKRTFYAISRVFVTYNDSGRTVFSSAALSGTFIAGAISNLYYPPQDVGVSHTINRSALDLGNTAIYNAAAEFWPDIQRGLKRMF